MASSIIPPAPQREFRGAWVASVGNANWPSRKDLTTAEQKAELIAILDRAKQLNLNAIIFQVRPACDALYASKIEPWSEYLTGTMGRAPSPFYDPLEFAVAEAHKRGVELHAWFNPYRALHPSEKGPVASSHVSKTRPELVRKYGKHLWLDPGDRATQDYSLNVVMDVVRRYDIDGVHFDDYFYPYQEKDTSGADLDFPDEASWKKFGRSSGLSRDDWRRENVNEFIQRVNRSVHAAKPWVKFGVSPFGIWRPGNPGQIRGYDAYGQLYADSRKWLVNGWLDYFAPQLYWAIEPKEQSFRALLNWWTEQNPKGRHLWPGINSTKVGHGWQPTEIVDQIRLVKPLAAVSGHVHWSMKSLMPQGVGLAQALTTTVYSQPALVPASPWLNGAAPGKPALSVSGASDNLRVKWSASSTGGRPALWVLQARANGQWTSVILPGDSASHTLTGARPSVISITPVGRTGIAGKSAVVERRGT